MTQSYFSSFIRLMLRTSPVPKIETVTGALLQGLGVAIPVAALIAVYAVTERINGWTLPESLMLVGVFHVAVGVAQTTAWASWSILLQGRSMGWLDEMRLWPGRRWLWSAFARPYRPAMWLIFFGIGLAVVSGYMDQSHAVARLIGIPSSLILSSLSLMVLSFSAFAFALRFRTLEAVFEAGFLYLQS